MHTLKLADLEILHALEGPAPRAPRRQPVHTVYGGAHLFEADTTRKLGALAQRAMAEYAPDASSFAAALGLPEGSAAAVHARVLEKLSREPVEDLRVDFEDGFGFRPDEEEDAQAVRAAEAMARGREAGTLPPFVGIRVKALEGASRYRAVRTLDRFLTTLAAHGGLPAEFRVTLPKVGSADQVAALVHLLSVLEARLNLPPIPVELMIESPSALVGPDGRVALPALVAATDGRCAGAHFGPYDFTASLEITAASQRLSHPACDFARNLMQLYLVDRGVPVSDGPTNLMPVGPHRAAAGTNLTPAQQEENRRAVRGAWHLHANHVRRALDHGIYQGWDLHPAQLPARYGAVYAFFLEGLPVATARLRQFIGVAAQATRTGQVFDDAATGHGLLHFFLRGLSCGALTEAEACASGLTLDELRARSFAAIARSRA